MAYRRDLDDEGYRCQCSGRTFAFLSESLYHRFPPFGDVMDTVRTATFPAPARQNSSQLTIQKKLMSELSMSAIRGYRIPIRIRLYTHRNHP